MRGGFVQNRIDSMRRLAAMGLVAVAVGAPASATGQDVGRYGSSILGLLPVTESLGIGRTVEGVLSETDFKTVTGVLVRAYELTGNQGDPVTIDLISEDMDSYLYLVGPGYDEPFTDDDTGGACNARLNAFLPEDGPYLLVVGSLGGEGGSYTLRVDNRGHPSAEGDCFGGDEPYVDDFDLSLNELDVQGTVETGVPVADTLTEETTLGDGSPALAWWYLGTPGDFVTFDLVSDDFDAMIYVIEEDGAGFFADDDSGNGCNSRLELEVTSSEPYRVVVSSIGGGGGFTLTLSTDPGPVGSEPCMGM